MFSLNKYNKSNSTYGGVFKDNLEDQIGEHYKKFAIAIGDFSKRWKQDIADEGQLHPTPNEIFNCIEMYQSEVHGKNLLGKKP